MSATESKKEELLNELKKIKVKIGRVRCVKHIFLERHKTKADCYIKDNTNIKNLDSLMQNKKYGIQCLSDKFITDTSGITTFSIEIHLFNTFPEQRVKMMDILIRYEEILNELKEESKRLKDEIATL